MTEYVEILTESRSLTLGRTSAGQDIVVQFKLPVDDEGELIVPEYLKADFMGATDDVLALEIAFSIFPDGRWLPGSDGNDIFLVITDIKLDQVTNSGWWKARASYEYDNNTGTGGARSNDPNAITLPFIKIGFSVGNATRNITQSLKVVDRASVVGLAGRPLPDGVLDNTIGITEDAINGAEIPASGLVLQITAYYFPEYVTYSFLKYLADLIPAKNSDDFLTFPPGTCAILGCDGQATVTDVIPITYTIDVKANVIDQTDYPFPNLTCDGQDYIDYRYIKQFDENAQTLAQYPSYRLIHQVLKSAPFSQLGFPTQ
jgi:hypothetical protein